MKTNSLNFSLSLMEVVVLTNLKLYETLEDKMTYVENFYRRYFNNVFRDKKYVINLYETKFNNKTLLESELDFTGYIKNVHNFIKKAINFDCLVEQRVNQISQSGTAIQPQKNVIMPNDKQYQGVQMGPASSVHQGVKVKMNRTLDTEKITKEFSWSEFFETLRRGLSSNIGQITTTILELIKPLGQAQVVIVWAGLAIYDFYNFYKNGDVSSLGKFLTDLIAIGFTFISTPGEENLIQGLGKKTFQSVDEFVRFFVEDPIGKVWSSVVSGFLGILSKIGKLIQQGVEWLSSKFNAKWPTEIVGNLINFLEKIKTAFSKAGFQPSESNYKHKYSRKTDTGKI